MKTIINQNQTNSTADIFINKGRFIKFMCGVLNVVVKFSRSTLSFTPKFKQHWHVQNREKTNYFAGRG